MSTDLLKVIASVRDTSNSICNHGSAQIGVAWKSYETVRIAMVHLPKRYSSLPYVLGVAAGVSFLVHDIVPQQPFKAGTLEAKAYSDGVKDAVYIQRAADALEPDYSGILESIFGGA